VAYVVVEGGVLRSTPYTTCISFIHGNLLIIGFFFSFIITMVPVGNLEKLKCVACNL
jgi:hypothetical protein